MREDGVTPTTWKLYKYSLLYLALLFVAMAGDRWMPFGHRSLPQQLIMQQKPARCRGWICRTTGRA